MFILYLIEISTAQADDVNCNGAAESSDISLVFLVFENPCRWCIKLFVVALEVEDIMYKLPDSFPASSRWWRNRERKRMGNEFWRRISSIAAVNDVKSLDFWYIVADRNDDDFEVYLRGVIVDDVASSEEISTREELQDFCWLDRVTATSLSVMIDLRCHRFWWDDEIYWIDRWSVIQKKFKLRWN